MGGLPAAVVIVEDDGIVTDGPSLIRREHGDGAELGVAGAIGPRPAEEGSGGQRRDRTAPGLARDLRGWRGSRNIRACAHDAAEQGGTMAVDATEEAARAGRREGVEGRRAGADDAADAGAGRVGARDRRRGAAAVQVGRDGGERGRGTVEPSAAA